MQYISAAEAKQQLGAILDAAQREPITIRQEDRDVVVVLSAEEYERLRGVQITDFNRFCDQIGQRAEAAGLDEQELNDILAAE